MIEILQNKENTDKIEFIAKDGDEVLGRIAGTLCDATGDTFVIDELECDEFFTDGLVRAILNLMTLHGIDKARFDVPEMYERLKKLHFIGDSATIDSIAEFFDKGCCHK